MGLLDFLRRTPKAPVERAEPTAIFDASRPPVVRLEHITKRFGAVTANQDITLDIHAGRILALLGENGAGKSTLMSILSGRYHPDEGRILVDGKPTRFDSSREAIDAGIGMVYQHFMLVPTMTAAQNVLLGQEDSFIVSPKAQEERVAALSARYGLFVDPRARVRDLSMGERQRVEILKLLARNSRVLIFDEPTAVLTEPEAEALFDALRRMAAQEKGIVFISHKLDEVMSIADEIAVLRRGRVVDRMPRSDVASKAELAERMVGREVLLSMEREALDAGDVVLAIEGLAGRGMHDVNLHVRRGEIVAVVGVAGNGQKELVETVTGMREPENGEVRLLGRPWREFFARPAWKDALAYIPEDRLGLATCPDLDMVENLLLTTRKGFSKGPFLQRKRARATTAELVERHNVQPPRPATQAKKLSGGNLQKLVIAREFYRTPKLIVAEQPTQGLDISATEEVWRNLLCARENAGVLLVTGDLSEALQLADRVAVMYRGRIMDTIPTDDEKRLASIGLLMAGVRE